MKLIQTILLLAITITTELFSQSLQVNATDLNAVFNPGGSTAVVSLSVDAIILNPMIASIRVDRTGTASNSDVATAWLALDKNTNNVYDTGDQQLGTTQSFSGGTVTFSGLNYSVSMLENILVMYDVAPSADVSKTAGALMGTDYIQGVMGTTITFSGITTGNNPLPVELVSFVGFVDGQVVNLAWTTATEINNYGFNVERSVKNNGWEKIGFVKGHGNSNSPKNYQFADDKIFASGVYSYRLKQIDFDGKFEHSEPLTIEITGPAAFMLKQNFPNPFNPETVINYQIPASGHVTLKVYDALGKEIATLVNEYHQAGNYNSKFSMAHSSLSSGVYFYVLSAGEFVESKKMLYLK